jgi:7,8-dihydropterin-6-yl-methyl-4-(beta-D-ribofuranosyl)aminobenzene 5'-phosphate synthase
MNKLGIDPKSIQTVMISHDRYGHLGGLANFLLINPKVTVYIPALFPVQATKAIKKTGATLFRVTSIEELQQNIFTLGEFLGVLKEQALALRTSKGMVVVTGCAHHGIINIMQRTKSLFPKEVLYLVLGGFHFSGFSKEEKAHIVKSFQKLQVKKVALCHCCEEAGRQLFEKAYGDNYLDMGAGGVITINSGKKK